MMDWFALALGFTIGIAVALAWWVVVLVRDSDHQPPAREPPVAYRCEVCDKGLQTRPEAREHATSAHSAITERSWHSIIEEVG